MERFNLRQVAGEHPRVTDSEECELGEIISEWRKAQQDPALSAEVNRIAQLKEAAENAIKTLALSHLYLALRFARSLPTRMSQEDAEQEFLMVLLRCAKNFDPERNTRFSTYANPALERKKGELLSRELTGGVTQDDNRQLRKLRSLLANYRRQRQSVSDKQLAVDLSGRLNQAITPANVRELLLLLKVTSGTVSIDQDVEGDDGSKTPVGDLIPDTNNEDGSQVETRLHTEVLVAQALKNLNEEEQLIIKYTYGIDGYEILDDQEIADRLGIEPEKVRDILRTAKSKIKHYLSEQ